MATAKKPGVSKGDLTRQHIIERSAPIFNRLGYGTTALSDLMKATGLEKGGIYRHFDSKESLAGAAFDYACHQAEEIRFREDPEWDDLQKFEDFILSFTQRRSSVPGGCPLFNTAVESDDGNPVLKKKAVATYEHWIDRLTRLLDQAKKAGQLKKNFDSRQLATFVFCSLEGALIAKNLTGDREILQQQTRRLLDILKSHRT